MYHHVKSHGLHVFLIGLHMHKAGLGSKGLCIISQITKKPVRFQIGRPQNLAQPEALLKYFELVQLVMRDNTSIPPPFCKSHFQFRVSRTLMHVIDVVFRLIHSLYISIDFGISPLALVFRLEKSKKKKTEPTR